MTERTISRRAFVADAAMAGLALTIVPRHVLGRGHRAPSDTLNIACIGAGGMGLNDVRGVSGENIYALCDVDWRMAEEAFRSFPEAKRYKDFREMLEQERDHIDAVTISTPDHTHAAAAVMALRMGKPVFCQKPLTRTLHEARVVAETARRARVATQMGNQGHAGEGTRKLREFIEAGAIGTVREVHFWTNRPIWPQAIERPLELYHVPAHLDWDLWLGPAPERPYHPAYHPFRWRGWWDFGTGALGDMGCHIMDAAFWTLELRYPARIEVELTEPAAETAPRVSRVTYDFPARGSQPQVKLVWRDGSLFPPRPAGVGDEERWPPEQGGGQVWVGDDGRLVAGAYGDNPRVLDAERQRVLDASPPPEKYPRSPGVYEEWIEACKGGPPAGSAFDAYAGPFTEMVLLGNLAVRLGRDLEIDPATGNVTNVTVPEEWITPAYRRGWTL